MFRKILLLFIVFSTVGIFTWKSALSFIGDTLVKDTTPERADAAVVLNTGVEYYPRLLQAAELYRQGRVKKIVINGNRKTDVSRKIEEKGFSPCCKWYADRLQILELYGVPKKDVIAVSAEDAFDTISEARLVGAEIINDDIKSIILATSKFHTKRAHYIWKNMYGKALEVFISPSMQDPYDPNNWWQSGRQRRWVMTEIGAWVYYYWHKYLE